MTQFGKIHALKASRSDHNVGDPALDFDRLLSNQSRGIETNFLADNNLMIDVDDACNADRPATNATLDALGLLEWVNFLRQCDSRGLRYAFTPFFAYAEMPRELAQSRASHLNDFARKFGLQWLDDEGSPDFAQLGRADQTFDSLDKDQQTFLAISFAALLLMLVVNRDGAEFSPLGKFRRYLREYKRLIGTVSVRELAIARYVFATQSDCPGALDRVRSRIEKNFARKDGKRPKDIESMYATALNGAFDLMLFMAMNVADTRGLEGRPLDCWLFTRDEKLKEYNDLCFNADMGTGQAGLFTVVNSHVDVSEYWRQSGEALHQFASEGSKRVLQSMARRALGLEDDGAILDRILRLPEKAYAVMNLAKTGL